MSNGQIGQVLRRALRFLDAQDPQKTDAYLLAQFVGQHDEASFAALVERHAPMVRAVCRRILGDSNDADDAFQAALVVLARRAASVRRAQSIGSWLYGVATHVALKVRDQRRRRRAHEAPATAIVEKADDHAEPAEELAHRELRAVLDEELGRLPKSHRQALVLHYFGARTQEQIAAELGCPIGSVWWRLEQARESLRTRLARRGFTVPATALAALLAENASAAVPDVLVRDTVRAALAGLGCSSTGPGVAVLANGVLGRAMWIAKVKVAVAILLVLGVAGGGGYWLSSRLAPVPSHDALGAAEGTAPRSSPLAQKEPNQPPPLPKDDPQDRMNKDVRHDVPMLARLLARGEEVKAQPWIAELAYNVDLHDLMVLFGPRHKDGLGVGRVPVEGHPDGIEATLQSLEKNVPVDLDYSALEHAALQTQTIARVVQTKFKGPFKGKTPQQLLAQTGKDKENSSRLFTDDFVKTAHEFALAAKARNSNRIQQAAKGLNDACLQCHTYLRGEQRIDFYKPATEALIESVRQNVFAGGRWSAIKSLGYRRAEAEKIIPILIEALGPTGIPTTRLSVTTNDLPAELRAEVLDSLRCLGQTDRTKVPAIDAQLRKESDYVRFCLAYDIGRAKSTTAGLMRVLARPDDAVRLKSIELLGQLAADTKEAYEALHDVQNNHPDAEVRLAASEALQRLGKDEGRQALVRQLKDVDPMVRGRAALALSRLRKAAVSDLRRVLKETEDREVRASAIEALGRIGPDAKDAVTDLREHMKGNDALLRKLAADALTSIESTP